MNNDKRKDQPERPDDKGKPSRPQPLEGDEPPPPPPPPGETSGPGNPNPGGGNG